MAAKAISRPRFEALTFSKLPFLDLFAEEREWYSDQEENVLGVVLWDKMDDDWSYVILGRDERALFRAIDQDINFPRIDAARDALHLRMSYHAISGETVFPQGDLTKRKKFELFRQVVADDELNANFRVLAKGKGYSAAREIMAEIAYTFEDPDGNYIQQFQSTAFDGRLWELFLYAFLHENSFLVDRKFATPDYLAKKNNRMVFIEAVTVNPTQGEGTLSVSPETEPDRDTLADFASIKFGSALFSKLKKRYWDLPHVKGHPLVLAIADFHQPHSMLWTHPYVLEYLYGIRAQKKEGKDGTEVYYQELTEHRFGDKQIPSGFFFQPEAENVSAVLFSNSGTIAKFNRMGKIAGFGDREVKMVRSGNRYDHGEGKLEPARFVIQIEEGVTTETWSEGVSIFHNPNPKVLLEESVFPTVGHHYFQGGRFVSHLPDFFPMASITDIFSFSD